ncbi:MAG: rhodanese-like domain-containing protein [Bacilli bacterium]
MKELTAFQLQTALEAGENVKVIDVRESYEVANGIIPDAIHMALGTIPDRFTELDASQPYAIICAAGVRSANACMWLIDKGFDVTNVVDGMYAWRGEVQL